MQIDSLTESQREVLNAVRAGRHVAKKYHASLHVLLRDGYVCRDQDTKQLQLSTVGQAVFDEDACRKNRASDFYGQQLVERSVFQGIRGGVTHEWVPYRVVGIGTARLIVCAGDAHIGETKALEPRYFRARSQS